MTEPILALSHICREFMTGDTKVAALADVTLDIDRGELVAIIG